jgi:putative SOS response-associated peptidase YedK
MCGRYTLRNPRRALDEILEQQPPLPLLEARYNIAPSQTVPIVRAAQTGLECALVKWGLIPSWATDAKIGYKLISARSETAASKPSFRAAFMARRCLIPVDGFYEWKLIDGKKQPYLIGVGEGQPFAFAGLWETWLHEGKTIESCTILTTEANERLRPLHERMPVIVPKEDHGLWLDTSVKDAALLQPLLRPYPAESTSYYPVSPLVNSSRNDDPRFVERLAPSGSLFGADSSPG